MLQSPKEEFKLSYIDILANVLLSLQSPKEEFKLA